MIHKGYAAKIDYSEIDGCFVGHISGIDDIVGFHGDSVAEMRAAFEEAVDDYLQTCKKLDRAPQETLSGSLKESVTSERLAAADVVAESNGNRALRWVADALADAEIPMPGLLGEP